MVSTVPRTLIQNMNVHLGRWIPKTDEVQLAIDSLPKELDQSENIDHLSEHADRTDSEKSGCEDQEPKNENSKGVNNLVEPTSKIKNNES